MAKLEAGAKAPAFTLTDTDGNKVSLSSFAGHKVVVYFYPRDDTPGCTKEACQFNDALSDFEGIGVPVIGISADKAASHAKFRDKYGLQFTLLSDPDHAVMEKYGAYGEKMMYGKKTVGVIRSTFLIDEKGKVARAWYSVKADGHAAKVLEEALAAGPR
jgi:peroxiredoxin Q/BCP